MICGCGCRHALFLPGNRTHLLSRGPSLLFWEVSQTADRQHLASGPCSFLPSGLVPAGSCSEPPVCVHPSVFERHQEMVSDALFRNNLSSPGSRPDGWTLQVATWCRWFASPAGLCRAAAGSAPWGPLSQSQLVRKQILGPQRHTCG